MAILFIIKPMKTEMNFLGMAFVPSKSIKGRKIAAMEDTMVNSMSVITY